MASHLTFWERDLLAEWLAAGHTKSEISRALGRDPSAIFRERQRNSCGGYHAAEAQRKCEKRQQEARCKRCKLRDPELRMRVITKLQQDWSPDEIAGRLRRDFPEDSRLRVSHQTIYDWLRNRGRAYRHHLRRHGKTRRRPPPRPRPGVRDRPAEINERTRCGDWEGDLIVSAGHAQPALITLVERKTGYTEIVWVPRRQAELVAEAIVQRLRVLPPHLRRSITFDNGTEFSCWKDIAETLPMAVYFAHPHSPWERGTNENTNGLIRQDFPKGTRFDQTTALLVQYVQDKLNARPRRRLDYQTPDEVFRQHRYRAIQS